VERRALPWSLSALLTAALVLAATWGCGLAPREPVMRFGLAPPEDGDVLWVGSASPLLLSPDGTRLALVQPGMDQREEEGRNNLFLRLFL